jgi:hypothetical protein
LKKIRAPVRPTGQGCAGPKHADARPSNSFVFTELVINEIMYNARRFRPEYKPSAAEQS